MAGVQKERLDTLLVEQGLADSQEQARRLIMAGQVAAGDQVLDKAGRQVPTSTQLSVRAGLPYASRGGIKLVSALDAFALDVSGWTVADVGASTGGFTDCLLQRGAARIYAIDVGYGQLAWKLQQDPRVLVMDRTNARYVKSLPELVEMTTIDVSFISLKLILPSAMGWLRPSGQILALIKPQFEAERRQVGRGGVVRDPAVHQAVLEGVTAWADARGLGLLGLVRSPITGPAGNVEFLAHWMAGAKAAVQVAPLIRACVEQAAAAQVGSAQAEGSIRA